MDAVHVRHAGVVVAIVVVVVVTSSVGRRAASSGGTAAWSARLALGAACLHGSGLSSPPCPPGRENLLPRRAIGQNASASYVQCGKQ